MTKIPADRFPQALQDPENLRKRLKDPRHEKGWESRGKQMAVKLFHEMSSRVPAYRRFLKKNRVRPGSIKTAEDLQNVPPVDKKSYLRANPLPDLCWDGKLDSRSWVFSATSGSTGEPFYFPRDSFEDWEYALSAELYMVEQFAIDKKTTLYVNGFAMGAWIGGLFTYQAIKHVAERGNYPLSIINPGINKEEILKAIRALGHQFDQIVIGGYPPFTKDLIDYGEHIGFPWKKYDIKFVFSAESFSERFRDYILQKAKVKDVLRASLNHYGTVDMGTMSHETPLSIHMRRIALKKKPLLKGLFGQTEKLPTLTQYIPELFYFEVENERDLLCTSRSGIPLVRYDLKDHGGVMPFKDAESLFDAHGMSLAKEAKKAGIDDTVWRLPFVYVYERSDFSLSWFGGNVYPEHVRLALQGGVSRELSGKFSMELVNDARETPRLVIHAEMKPGKTPGKKLAHTAESAIIDTFLETNSEYRILHATFPERMHPKVVLWRYNDPKYFAAPGKQKWILK